MDIHELLNKLKASCKLPLASDSENAAVAAIEAHLANSVPLVSKEPDGYPRLGCGTLAKIGMKAYIDGSQFTIAGLFKTTANLLDSLGVPFRQAKLADLVASPPKPVTPVDALRQIHELLSVIETPTHCENLALSIARDVLSRETETTEFTCPKCRRHRATVVDDLYACWYGDCRWSGDKDAFIAEGGTP